MSDDTSHLPPLLAVTPPLLPPPSLLPMRPVTWLPQPAYPTTLPPCHSLLQPVTLPLPPACPATLLQPLAGTTYLQRCLYGAWGETEMETNYENSDINIADTRDVGGGEGYHIGARRKLAEMARRALKEADKLNAIILPVAG